MSANVVFIKVWTDAATEHIEVRSMFTAGAPYVTIYIDGPIQCSDHRILHALYYAGGEARTAQTFVCSFCGESIDVANVHAPSGTRQLMDSQRQTLLTNLLQSNSRTRPGRTIGNAHFVIGGDMNTAPFRMSQLLQTCRDDGTLRTQEETAVAATEHSEETTKRGDIIKPEDFLQESQEEAAAGAAAVATGAQRRDYPCRS